MKKILSVLLLVILVGCSQIKNNLKTWNTMDTACTVTMLGVQYIDYRQTRVIANNPEKYHEINPLLGKHPSVGDVNTYFVISALGKIGVAAIIPPKYRRLWIGSHIGLSMYLINRNKAIGIDIPF